MLGEVPHSFRTRAEEKPAGTWPSYRAPATRTVPLGTMGKNEDGQDPEPASKQETKLKDKTLFAKRQDLSVRVREYRDSPLALQG